ncbi:MAG: NADH-quinone oxidoreductase subunit N [Verrucomicrobiota bacterium]|nr:NADH-quinone oxidoreductase subunit N [Limisphaera sp.]MDW8383102.1 NADH-quinone oxidoreductase subunit N [Verrucomicrobiota bacterium]
MKELDYVQLLRTAIPEIVLLGTALVVLLADQAALRGVSVQIRWRLLGLMAGTGTLAALVMALLGQPVHAESWVGAGFAVDGLAWWVRAVVLILSGLTVALSVGCARTRHVGEYLGLLLFGTVGLMVLVSASDFLVLFIALELSSVTLYVLAAFEKDRAPALEAGLKYFLLGSVSAAFMLYGISLVYGSVGTTRLQEVSAMLGQGSVGPGLWAGMALMIAGLAFKVAAAPFHLWAPDVYEGAPTPSAALIASGSKVIAFAVLIRLLMTGFPNGAGSAGWGMGRAGWSTLVMGLTLASLVWGNLAALVQGNVRRLLAYSAVAHAGYGLLGLLTQDQAGLTALLYFVATYALSAVGAFGVVALVENFGMGSARMVDFAGLGQRSRSVAICLTVFLLSQAGIPPLAGFFGKFYLFLAALGSGQPLALLWMVVIAVALSTVSLYYYLRVLKEVWVRPVPTGQPELRVPWEVQTVLWLSTAAVVLLGLYPSWILRSLEAAFGAGGL